MARDNELRHFNPYHDPRTGQFTVAKGGSYTSSRAVDYTKRKVKYGTYNKKHIDRELKEGAKLSTLSYDPNRTEGVDMYYATHTGKDRRQYGAMFNKPISKPVYDEDGNYVGTGDFYKYRITNTLKSNMKVASEDSGARAFTKLYKENGDFYKFVTDEDRMQSYFVRSKYRYKGYREARAVLRKIDKGETPTSDELKKVYRMFNYVLPYDGAGNAANARDINAQRAKFFAALKEDGYGAVLDTNDALYGSFKAQSPIIVFDTSQAVPTSVKQTTYKDKALDSAIHAAEAVFGSFEKEK